MGVEEGAGTHWVALNVRFNSRIHFKPVIWHGQVPVIEASVSLLHGLCRTKEDSITKCSSQARARGSCQLRSFVGGAGLTISAR